MTRWRWRKLGFIFQADHQFPWMVSHASNPVAEIVRGTEVRIYFSCRDAQKRSSIGYVIVDLERPKQVLSLSSEPVLCPGEPGYFDDSGTSMGCLVKRADGSRHLYYLGWNLGVTVPFRNSIGLAVSADAQATFEKVGNAPILDRNQIDPLTLSYPWVLETDGQFRMWYGSHLSWNNGKHEMIHVLKAADSSDGINWQRDGRVLLPLLDDEEFGMSRPTVLQNGALYRMWFSIRGKHYRLAYAESEDGRSWHRADDLSLPQVSKSGWDSESICYPAVFYCAGNYFMLYNGNNYGASGFGLAIAE